MQRGYLKLWRKIQDHRVYQNADLLKLFLHLLMNANIVDKTWNGELIRRGELACGREGLAKDLREKPSTIYKRLQALTNPNYNLIALRSNNHYTVVTILNYDTYQPTKIELEQQGSSKVAALEQQGSTTKELKNERIKKEEEGFSLDTLGETVRRLRKSATAQITDSVLVDLDLWQKDFPGLDIPRLVQLTLRAIEAMDEPPADAVAYFLQICRTEQAHRKALGVDLVAEVVAYLNGKTGKNFKPSTLSTGNAIRGRQAEGHTLADFKSVIDKKCSDWLKDPKMEPYLSPDTLFRPANFEKYLNQINSGATDGSQNGVGRGRADGYETAQQKRDRRLVEISRRGIVPPESHGGTDHPALRLGSEGNPIG